MPKLSDLPEYRKQQKLGLLQRFARIFQKQIDVKDNTIPAYAPNSPQSDLFTNVIQPEVLQPIEPIQALEPNNYSRVWVDTSGYKTQYDSDKPLSTEIGSLVEDPLLDKLRQSSLSSDVQERASFYDQIDLVFQNCPVTDTALENLLQGAFGQDQEQKVEPARGYEKDPRAIEMAINADRMWQSIVRKITPYIRMQRMRTYFKYGNLFIRVDRNIYGSITKTDELPTTTIKINSDQNLSFYPNQPDAYQQYTRDYWGKPYAYWPDISIIEICNKQSGTHRYGMPFILPALGYVRGLVKGTNLIPDAREAGLPFVEENHQDAIGNAVSKDAINEARFYSRESKKNRNEQTHPFEHRVTNGKVTVKMHNADGSFWNETKDFTWFATNITSRFNRNFAKQAGAEIINRATLNRITENEYEGEYRLSLFFATMHDVVLLNKQIAIANFAIAQIDKRYGLEPHNLFIDPDMVQLYTKVKAKQLPERLINKAELAAMLYTNFGCSQETLIEAGISGLDLVSKEEEIKRMQQEGLLGKRPEKVIIPSISKGAESFLLSENNNYNN